MDSTSNHHTSFMTVWVIGHAALQVWCLMDDWLGTLVFKFVI